MKRFCFLVLLILFLALVLRFYNFPRRFFIYSDQARDALVARGALQHRVLPQVGSFSSAGPFVFGPIYYWILMLAYFIAPNFMLSPWVLFVFLDLALVLVMVKIGQALWQEKGGLIAGLMTALSPALISTSSNINQQTLVSLFTALTILFFILYGKKENFLFMFLMSLSVGLGISMHYQALNLFFYTGVFLYPSKLKRKNIKKISLAFLLFALGLLLPNLPLLSWDYTQQWANIRNILDYFLLGQYRIWVSSRWLTYLSIFWPNLWTGVAGGNLAGGIVLMLFSGFWAFHSFLKRKIKKEILALGIIFLLQVILNRYYRGQRFEGYMLYFYPLILVFSTWVILKLYHLNKILGCLFLILVVIFTFVKDIKIIKNQDNKTALVWQTIDFLQAKYPEEKFRLYDFYYLDPSLSHMLSLFMDFKNLIDEKNGVSLGISQGPVDCPSVYKVSLQKEFYICQLNEERMRENKGLVNVNPDYIYQDISFWWKDKPLRSTFYLKNFLKDKLGL